MGQAGGKSVVEVYHGTTSSESCLIVLMWDLCRRKSPLVVEIS